MIYNYKKHKIEGIYEIFLKPFEDNRGKLCKIFHRPSFEQMGIECTFDETIVTTNNDKGIFRGYHFQTPPYAQKKVMYAATGSFISILIDIRKKSPTYGQHETITVDGRTSNMIYLTEGIAAGYCILEAGTIVVYNMTSVYNEECGAGIRYDSVDIKLPFDKIILSDKDMSFPHLKDYNSPF